MTDGRDASSGAKRVSDSVFFSAVVLTTLLVVMGVAILLIGTGGSSRTAPPVPGPAASQSLPQPSPSKSSPRVKKPQPPKAGAVALVEKYFRLGEAGDFEAACALESPAYLKFDAEHYPGGCVGGARTVTKALAAQGLSIRMTGAKVIDFGGGSATVLADIKIGTRTRKQYVYLTYHAGRWWISGSDDSLDVGY